MITALHPLVCPWCWHGWHGMACRAHKQCRCETTIRALDDTWRPRRTWQHHEAASHVMADTGVDGWSALLLVTPTVDRDPAKVRAVLYGRAS